MEDLTTGSITRHLLKTTSFMLVTMVFQTLYFLVDLYWVGRLGKEPVEHREPSVGIGVAIDRPFKEIAIFVFDVSGPELALPSRALAPGCVPKREEVIQHIDDLVAVEHYLVIVRGSLRSGFGGVPGARPRDEREKSG